MLRGLVLTTELQTPPPPCPKLAGLCSHSAHLWATSVFVPCSEALGTPKHQGLCSQSAHLWATSDLSPTLKP